LRAGEHVVRASRPGYQTQTRHVVIEAGADAEVRFTVRRSPRASPGEVGRVRLSLPQVPHVIRVDGEDMIGMNLELPVGMHRIELEVRDRQPYEGTIRVAARLTITIAPPLAWTLDARRARLDGAAQQRDGGIGLLIAGGVLAAASAGVLVWNEIERPQTTAAIDDLQRMIDEFMGGPPPGSNVDGCEAHKNMPPCMMWRDQLYSRQVEAYWQEVALGLSLAGIIVGGVAVGIGLPLWLTAPSTEDVDAAAARAALYFGPGRLDLIGSF
jgi:hypothetical protein